ncbi:MAG: hypothetical protein WD048_07145 [Chitinophagales bacterium]
MEIFCLEDFKEVFEKLKSKRTYRDIEKQTIGYFFGKTVHQLANGTRLNNSTDTPYIKKRIGGSGGFNLRSIII